MKLGHSAGDYAGNPGPGLLQGWQAYRGRKGDLAQTGRIQLGWRKMLANTTLTFGINNIGDTRPPLSVQGGTFYQGFDTQAATPIGRYFYFEIEKKF